MLRNKHLHIFDFAFDNTTDGSLFETLRTKHQTIVTGGTQQIFAIRSDKRLQECFNLKPSHPVLHLNRKI